MQTGDGYLSDLFFTFGMNHYYNIYSELVRKLYYILLFAE